ncbi:MAG: tRNA/rRNA methyltransferase [Bacteroidota bacterium]
MLISFVLVEPATPENVGAAARAIKTMGFHKLLLVNPCDHLSDPARWLAHGSGEILENAQVFASLHQAVAGFDMVIGTTAKSRSVRYDYHPLTRLPEIIKSKGNTVKKVAIVFGREESGLRNEELKLCHLVSTVPMKTTFPSLNLAQAVMLYAWELSKIEYDSHKAVPDRNEESFHSLYQKVETLLKEAGFKENSAIYPRFLERISLLNEGDIHLLHSYCNKLLSEKK